MREPLLANAARSAAGRRARGIAGLGVLAAACFAVGFLLAPAPSGTPDASSWFTRSTLPQPVPVGDFNLDSINAGGGVFTRRNLLGRWTLMYFGYRGCPDVCRPALESLAQIAADLAARHPGVAVAPVFVTVDPARDTPQRLRDYASGIDAGMVVLRGDDQAIAELARQVGILYTREAVDARGSYLVDHPATILLIDPRARLVAGFSPPHDAARIVERIVEMDSADSEQYER